MDYLGKIADVFVMITVLFIFPVLWGLAGSQNAAEMKLKDVSAEFMENIDREGCIRSYNVEQLIWKTERLGTYFVNITIRRRNSLIMGIQDLSEEIELNYTDTVLLEISDRTGPVYSVLRVII